MKIQKVTFKNLNSLVGDWSIDFTNPNFVNSGIFAITGPTGAGKSTILDAICLALYGKTPRLDRLNQSSNDIMSRGTGECSSEVTFEIDGASYRCTWQQRRARGDINGALQTQKHEIANATTGEVLVARVSEVDTYVEQLTGMNFDRFTRSILLAQGKFAAFLQSTANERAPILEQITGTEIYTDISKAAFEQAKQASEKLKLFQAETSGIQVQTPEEIEAVEAELGDRNRAATVADQTLTSLEAAKQWLVDKNRFEGQIEADNRSKAQNDQDLVAFQPNMAILDKDSRASKLRVRFNSVESLRQQLTSDRNQQAIVSKEVSRLEELKKTTLEAHSIKQAAVVTKEKELTDQRAFVQPIRELDIEIRNQTSAINNLRDDVNKIQTEVNRLQQSATESNSALAAHQTEKEELVAANESRKQDAAIVELLSGIESDFCTLSSAIEEAKRKHAELATGKTNLENSKADVDTKQAAMVAAQGTHAAAESNYKSGCEAMDAILKGRPLTEYESDVEHLNDKLTMRKLLQNFEEHRAQLQPGQECPLCGSMEHPYAGQILPAPDEIDEKLKEIRQLIQSAKGQESKNNGLQLSVSRALQAHELAKANHESATLLLKESVKQVENRQREYSAITESVTTQRRKLSKDLEKYGVTEEQLTKPDEILNALRTRRDTWISASERINALTLLIASLSTSLSGINRQLEDLNRSLTTKQNLVAEADATLKLNKERRFELYADKVPDTEIQRLESEHRTSIDDELKARERLQLVQNDWTEKNTTLLNLITRVNEITLELQQQEASFAAELIENDFQDESDFKKSLLSDLDRSSLTQKRDQLNLQKRVLEEALERNKAQLDEILSKNLTDRSLQETQQQISDLKQKEIENQQRIGELRSILQTDRDNRTRLSNRIQESVKLEQDSKRWHDLSDLIGSATGKAFRNIAQRLNFERLIGFANKQLSAMSDRYLLALDPNEAMDLNVIDLYYAGQQRTTKNLSGGESFIVSLSLALGLSRMASDKVRVDSLFLDEGFGTLDEDSLSVALDTLADLQHEGKLIGVISHVPALKERISTQIKVIPTGSGRSRLQLPTHN